MNRARCHIQAFALLSLGAFSAFNRLQAEQEPIGLASSDKCLWVYQQRHDTEQLLLHFAVRALGAKADSDFRALSLSPVVGRPQYVAAVDRDLYIFFADGTHRKFHLTDTQTKTLVLAESTIERFLPNSMLPAALVGDDVHNQIYAIISSRQLQQLELEADRSRTSDNDNEPLLPPAPDIRRPGLHDHDRVIVRYENGAWTFDREAPADLALETPILACCAHDRAIQIVSKSDGDPTRPTFQESLSSAADWSAADKLDLLIDAESWGCGWVSESLIVFQTTGAANAMSFRGVQRSNDKWIPLPELMGAVGEAVEFSKPIMFGTTPSGVTALSSTPQGEPKLDRWSLDGRNLENGTLIKALLPPPEPPVNQTVTWILEYGLLAFVLTGSFVWRRERVLIAAPLKEYIFARLARRAAALGIDLVILSPILILLTVWMVGDQLIDWSRFDFESLNTNTQTLQTLWFRAACGLVLALYAIPFEYWLGTTPGKRIIGCSVTNEQGERCRFVGILIRNLLRPIEFHFVPLAALVLITPGRQRVGDLMAKTVVVERRPLEPPAITKTEDENTL